MKHAPRGWNSWDSYAGWINGDGDFGNAPQADVLQAASYMAEHLLQYGWDTVVIDEGWAWASPTMEVIDDYGRPYPNQTLYPSSADGNGFLNLSTQVSRDCSNARLSANYEFVCATPDAFCPTTPCVLSQCLTACL